MKNHIRKIFWLVSLLSFVAPAHADGDVAGTVVFAIGTVTATAKDGAQRVLAKRENIYSGDTISTSARSQTQLRMMDNAFVSIKPDTVFRIDDYRQSSTNKEDNVSKLELIKGGFRAITGQIGKRNQSGYQLKTPVATMGIRGTDYVVMFCQDDCAHQEDRAKAATSAAANGLYVGVIDGGVQLLNKLGSINLSPNQFGFISQVNPLPRLLDRAPSFLMFDRTAMGPKDVRDLKRLISSRILASSRGADDGDRRERSSGDTQSDRGEDRRESPNVARGLDRDGPSLPGLPSASKAGAFVSALDLDKMDASLSDLVDSNKFQDFASSSFSTNLNRQFTAPELSTSSSFSSGGYKVPSSGGNFGTGWNSSNNLDPTLNPPWLPGYTNTNPPPPAWWRYSVFDADFMVPEKNWSGQIGDVDIGLNGSAPSRVAQISNASRTEYLLANNTLKDLGYDPQTQLTWGRWVGGTADIKTPAGSSNVALDNNGMHWIMGPLTQQTISLPVTGTATYQLIGNTNPTDNLGNIGVLGSASLTANFSTQKLDANLQLGINNQTWTATGQGINMQSPSFSTTALAVDVKNSNGALATGTGSLSGTLVPPTNVNGVPTGAAMTYRLNAAPLNTNTTVTGAAALAVKP